VTAVTDVKIYSNAKEVELLLNGKSQGKRADGTTFALSYCLSGLQACELGEIGGID
jgi:hypothetical protein